MKTKQLATTLLATSLLFGVSLTTASAKTKSMKVSVNKLTEQSTYVKGKTKAKATVKVTRKGITYAKGHANTKGVFKLKAKYSLTGNWHYRVTVSKKGYKTVKKTVAVKTVKYSKNTTTNNNSVAPTNKPGVLNPENTNVAGLQPGLGATVMTNVEKHKDEINKLNEQIAGLKVKADSLSKKIAKTDADGGKRAKAEMMKEKYEEFLVIYRSDGLSGSESLLDSLKSELEKMDANSDDKQLILEYRAKEFQIKKITEQIDEYKSIENEVGPDAEKAEEYYQKMVGLRNDADKADGYRTKLKDINNQISDLQKKISDLI
ncbi:hypothetical protein [Lentilactobacillus sp. Marseille-Q4993]|uniref:hypothetical protein n=1 Tax=Lentilactobacillus sp. Marseille-Q4993 TaxID=3039492 RepID=UPI0024BC7BDB|nr:hypothetical protein [Lentilactobacillus sp. Marseille-Q4993]